MRGGRSAPQSRQALEAGGWQPDAPVPPATPVVPSRPTRYIHAYERAVSPEADS